jgi:flagellar FliL protein
MANTKPKEQDKAADGEEAPKKSKKMLFIIVGVLVLLIGGGAGYYFLGMKKEHAEGAEPAQKVEEAKEPIYVALEPFTLNLRSGGQYLQIGITLQMKDEKEAARLKTYTPSARSRLLLLLSNKTSDEISDEEGKNELKKEILEKLTEPFSEKAAPISILQVLFTSFVIQ